MASSETVLYSLLDLSPIGVGSTASASFRHTLELAQLAERLSYHRYWLAEHHNIPGIASAATAVVIGHVAGGTKTIRVGSGGIMLPNHAPLVIAEQFGTLESLYPGRIDLGLGRAPGGDGATARALRKYLGSNGDTFPQDLAELKSYFRTAEPGQKVHAIPGEGLNVPLYILGSSDFGARLAAAEGLPYGFASHFAPDYLHVALELYRGGFVASEQLASPHAMVTVNIFAADTDAAARRLATSMQQAFLNLIRGTPSMLPMPVDSMDGLWSDLEAQQVGRMLRYSAIGTPDRVRSQLQAILDDTHADELILTCQTADHAGRLRSIEIGAEVMKQINAEKA